MCLVKCDGMLPQSTAVGFFHADPNRHMGYGTNSTLRCLIHDVTAGVSHRRDEKGFPIIHGSPSLSNSRIIRTVANIVSLPSLTCCCCLSDKISGGKPMATYLVRICELRSRAIQQVVQGVWNMPATKRLLRMSLQMLRSNL